MANARTPSLALLLALCACSPDELAEVDTDLTAASTGDGESSSDETTEAQSSDESTGVAPSGEDTSEPSMCGNGVLEDDEACDDGINDGRYGGGCLPDCSASAGRCGDGLVQPGRETCDDGAQNGTTGCNAWCRVSGSKLAELEIPTQSWDPIGVLAVADGRVLVTSDGGRELWSLRDEGFDLSSEHVLELPSPWRAKAMVELGDGRIAIAGGVNGGHDLRVLDIDPLDDQDMTPHWAYENLDPNSGGVHDLLLIDDELLMFGDRLSTVQNEQERWIHRINPYAHTWKAPVVRTWMGRHSSLRPRAIFHPGTGLVAVFQARTGMAGTGMLMSVVDPSTGAQLSTAQEAGLDGPDAVCLRPDGEIAVFAHPLQAGGRQQVVGYELDASGKLDRGASHELDLGDGPTQVVSCVAAPAANLLVGRVGDEALVMLVEDLVGDEQSVAWQHIGVHVGLAPKQAALAADYRDGRFYVALGWETSLAVFAR